MDKIWKIVIIIECSIVTLDILNRINGNHYAIFNLLSFCCLPLTLIIGFIQILVSKRKPKWVKNEIKKAKKRGDF